MDYFYDAFISYRHLPLDKAVAEKLQTLLEAYRLPRSMKGRARERINRVFRDQSELPTTGDLSAGIREALQKSRFLIVICSEETRQSHWCMEEINYFKELHGGANDNILTLLVSGEPHEVFPQALCYEMRPSRTAEGETVITRVDVEPLCADVRASSTAKSLKLLKTEFLRLAAPILNCRYDDLYMRHRRRKAQQAWTIGGAAALGLAALAAYSSVMVYQLTQRQTALYTNESLSLSYYAGKAVEQGDPMLGMLLALRALPQNNSHPERPVLPQAEAALRSAVFQQEHHKAVLPYYQSLSFQFNTDNVYILKRSEDEAKIVLSDYTTNFVYDTYNGSLIFKMDGNLLFDSAVTTAVRTEIKRDWDNHTATFQAYDVQTGELISEALYTFEMEDEALHAEFAQNEDILYFWYYKYTDNGSEKTVTQYFNIRTGTKLSPEEGETYLVKNTDSDSINYPTPITGSETGEVKEYLSPGKTYSVTTEEIGGSGYSALRIAKSGDLLLLLALEGDGFTFTSDDKYAAFILENKLFVIDMADLSPVYTMEGEEELSISDMEFTEDGKLILVSLFNSGDNLESYSFPDTVRVVDWKNNTVLVDETGWAFPVHGKPWFYVNTPGKVVKYEYKPEFLSAFSEGGALQRDLRFSVNGERALVEKFYYPESAEEWNNREFVTLDGRISLFDTTGGELLIEREVMKRRLENGSSAMTQVYFYTPDMTKLVCLTTEGVLEYWDVPGKTLLWSLSAEEDYPVSVAIDDGMERIACAYNDNRVDILRASDGQYMETIDSNPYEDIIQLEFQNNLLLASSEYQTYVVNLATGSELTFDETGNDGVNTDRYLTEDGLIILSRSGPFSPLEVYGADTGEELFSPEIGAIGWAYSSKTGTLVYRNYTSESNYANTLSVVRWNGESFAPEAELVPKDAGSNFFYDNSGRYLILNGEEGTVVYDMTDKSLVLEVRDTLLAMYNNSFYALGSRIGNLWPQPVIKLPFYTLEELTLKAGDLLESRGKKRELTREELIQYFIETDTGL